MNTETVNKVRVRFAPSPTGFLHLGGARTALYNYLYSHKLNGTFILRIEDTDETRSTKESLESILNGLKWLGLNWDEGPETENQPYGPYFQMQRHEKGMYTRYGEQLINNGHAYCCYCTPDELELQRADAMRRKVPPKYNARCRTLTPEERKKKEAEGRKPVIRFKMPNTGKTVFHDLIRGDVEFDNALLDDFVLVKTSGVPTFNFAVVIDDHCMAITHVLRGDDHISNTPRQILLFNALGLTPPAYAHFPMIHGSDGGKLSKRHGAVAVFDYKNAGYLPEAMINYLALLGWSTEDSQQLFKLNEMSQKFSLEHCGKSSAVFDFKKLEWMNGVYIRELTIDKLLDRLSDPNSPILQWAAENGVTKDTAQPEKREFIKKIITAEHEKIKFLTDIPGLTEYFIKDITDPALKLYDEKAVTKSIKSKPDSRGILTDLRGLLEKQEDYSVIALEASVRAYVTEKNIGAGAVFHPLRVAVSGRTTGPGVFNILSLLGKERVLKRLDYTLNNLV
ncbi:MAG: glutamate--tRNA ligase [Elusimicrobiota bacterium]